MAGPGASTTTTTPSTGTGTTSGSAQSEESYDMNLPGPFQGDEEYFNSPQYIYSHPTRSVYYRIGNMVPKMPCVDTDGGARPYVWGEITLSNGSIISDKCIGPSPSTHEETNSLWEYSCAIGIDRVVEQIYICSNGCLNGACLR